MRKLFLLAIVLLSFYGLSIAKEVPFTQEDRDRLIKVEALGQQIDELRTLMLWGFCILFSGIGILIGLVRRTTISPIG